MDVTVLFDTRFAALYGMLLTSILLLTAEEPAAVPQVFQKIWRHYRIYQEMSKKRSSEKPSNDFWEIDMTNFEP
ncbi:MAG: hypothetical protein AABZ15_12115 [Nitrospirota bacterium]